jgi:hypothetical protein
MLPLLWILWITRMSFDEASAVFQNQDNAYQAIRYVRGCSITKFIPIHFCFLE